MSRLQNIQSICFCHLGVDKELACHLGLLEDYEIYLSTATDVAKSLQVSDTGFHRFFPIFTSMYLYENKTKDMQ